MTTGGAAGKGDCLFVEVALFSTSLSNRLSETLSNDDVEYFVRIFTLLHADDTVILAESPEQLQKALDAAYEYCQNWGLSVNTSKTKAMVFSRGRVRSKPTIKFGENLLEVVNEYVYLGTTFSSNGSMKAAVQKQIAQANRAMFKLRAIAVSLNLPVKTQCELYDRMIVPVLTYGCEVWGTKHIAKIELFHRRFMRQLLKLPRSTAKCMLHGELGRFNHEGFVAKRMISYWLRLKQGTCGNIAHKLYLFQKGQFGNGFNSKWLENIKRTLDTNGFSNLFDVGEVNAGFFLKSLERRMSDIYLQQWESEMRTNSLCTNYRIFKTTFEMEHYLTELSAKQWQKLIKFRCGSHKLPVTLSRREHRPEGPSLLTCPLCKRENNCDEYHYVLQCSGMNPHREQLFPELNNTEPNMHKFRSLLSSTFRSH